MNAQVIESGVYQIVRGSTRRRGAWVVRPRHLADLARVESNATVRAVPGVTLGVIFQVQDYSGNLQSGSFRLRFLDAALKDGKVPSRQGATIVTVGTSVAGWMYTFHRQEEVTHGRWSVELWANSYKLAEHVFTVEPPEAVVITPAPTQAPVADRIPASVKTCVEGRSGKELTQLEGWVQKAISAGRPPEKLSETLVASGWPELFSSWLVDEVTANPVAEAPTERIDSWVRVMPWDIMALTGWWIALGSLGLVAALIVNSGDWSATRWFLGASVYSLLVARAFNYRFDLGSALSVIALFAYWTSSPGYSMDPHTESYVSWLGFGAYVSAILLGIALFNRPTYQFGGFFDFVGCCPNCLSRQGRWGGFLWTAWRCAACGCDVRVAFPWTPDAKNDQPIPPSLPKEIAVFARSKSDGSVADTLRWVTGVRAAGFSPESVRQRVLQDGWDARIAVWLTRTAPVMAPLANRGLLPPRGGTVSREIPTATTFLALYWLVIGLLPTVAAAQYLVWSVDRSWAFALGVALFALYSVVVARTVTMSRIAGVPTALLGYAGVFLLGAVPRFDPGSQVLAERPDPTLTILWFGALMLSFVPLWHSAGTRKWPAAASLYGLVGLCPACPHREFRYFGFLWTSWACKSCGCTVTAAWPWQKLLSKK